MNAKLPFTWIRVPAETVDRLITQRRERTQQRDAWRGVALEQAQTIKTLRALLAAKGPRPAHSYRDEAYEAAGVHKRATGKSPTLQARYDIATRAWIEPDLPGLPADVYARLWPQVVGRASRIETPPRAMVLGDLYLIDALPIRGLLR